MLRTMPLFKRWPRLRPELVSPIVREEAKADYPEFKEDFEILDRELVPYFERFDQASLQAQNRFRWEQLVLILLSTLATALGAFQAATSWPGFGVMEAVVGAALAALVLLAQQLGTQKKYYTNRLKAELLRSEYFLFLGSIGRYDDPQRRTQVLRHRVAQIRTDEVSL